MKEFLAEANAAGVVVVEVDWPDAQLLSLI
jgi:hypothetical protein